MLNDATRLKIAIFMANALTIKQMDIDNLIGCMSQKDSIAFLEECKKELSDTAPIMVSDVANNLGVSLEDLVAFQIERIDDVIGIIKSGRII